MVACLERSFRGAKDLAHLRIFHLIIVAHREDSALDIRQAGYGSLEAGLRLVTIKIIISHQLAHDVPSLRGVQRRGIAGAPQEIDRLVDGYAIQPGGELSLALIFIKIDPCLDKSLLQHIIRVVMTQNDMPYLPVERLTVFSHHTGESPLTRCRICQ